MLIISLALAFHGYALAVSMAPVAGFSDDEAHTELKVLNSNLLLDNDEYEEIQTLVAELEPDIIVLQEYTNNWDTALTSALIEYPHRATQPSHGVFGIAIFSKYPLANQQLHTPPTTSMKTLSADIQIGEKSVTLFAVHPPPPTTTRFFNLRNESMLEVATLASAIEAPVIMMGDFNATPWTANYSKWLSRGKLHNARSGFGFHPTWPRSPWLMRIPIDHILLNKRIKASEFGSVTLQGSDHRAIWSTLLIR